MASTTIITINPSSIHRRNNINYITRYMSIRALSLSCLLRCPTFVALLLLRASSFHRAKPSCGTGGSLTTILIFYHTSEAESGEQREIGEISRCQQVRISRLSWLELLFFIEPHGCLRLLLAMCLLLESVLNGGRER